MSTGVLRRIAAPVTIAALALAAAVVPAQAVSTPGWRIVKLIGPTGQTSGVQEIAATGPGDAWAAGFLCSGCAHQRDQLLVEHWTGGVWKQVALPSKIATKDSIVLSLAAHSARDAWVFAGPTGGPAGIRWDALRWNGTRWSAHLLPAWVVRFTGAGNSFNAAADFGPADVWDFSLSAMTQPLLAAHFNGRTWKKVRLPAVPFFVSAPSRHDIWAVGATMKTRGKPFGQQVDVVMHWNGRSWHTMRLPRIKVNPRFAGISGLVASGPRDVWVGIPTGGSGSNLSGLLLHWNGQRWARVRVPRGVFNQPTGAPVAQDGHGGVWLQGNGPAPAFLLYLYHYNNGRWTRFLMPEGTKVNLLGFSWIPGTRSVWAVGHFNAGPGNTVKGLIAKDGP
jgi:hypothetical protein